LKKIFVAKFPTVRSQQDWGPEPRLGKSSKSVQCAMLKACDACADNQTWASYSALYQFGRLSQANQWQVF